MRDAPSAAGSAPLEVLFVTRKWAPAIGGMETYSRSLADALAPRVRLTVRALPGRRDGSPPSPGQLGSFLVRTAFFLRSRREWDVVHFGDLVLHPLARLQRRWRPSTTRVVTVYGLDLLYGNRRGAAPCLYRRFLAGVRTGPRVIDSYLCISANTARLCREAGLEPIDIVPLGAPEVDPSSSGPAEPGESILFLGRLVRRKGCRWFAEQVLPLLPEPLELRVVGKPWDSDEVKALRENPRVRLLGPLDPDSLERELATARLMVVPNVPTPDRTDVEGFGLVALEGAARGVPTLVAELEGLSDAVIDGKTGFLLPAMQADVWREHTLRILSWGPEERFRFAALARRTVAEDYSWSRVAERTELVYRRCREQERVAS